MPAHSDVSLVVERDSNAAFAYVADVRRMITVGEFAADIAACAHNLPSRPFVINACTNRYRFAVVFFAAISRGQVNLLPARRDAAGLEAARRHYGDCVVVADHADVDVQAAIDGPPGSCGTAAMCEIGHDQLAAVVFTSGSTGTPKPHRKTWGLLDHFRKVHWRYLRRVLGQTPPTFGLVATVPPWHMYGLEWSLLLPTVAPAALYCGADYLPHDVALASERFDNLATVLVSTPTHLRALLKSGVRTGTVAATLSATAPLANGLAAEVKARVGGALVEIYGASEVGSLAMRLPLGEPPTWQFFDCFNVSFDRDAGEVTVTTPHLPKPITLQDRFEQTPQQRFVLCGRSADVVKVGGKRESLVNLNAALMAIPGVEDGVIYDPEQLGLAATGRLGAMVVAPELTATGIRAEMGRRVGSAFVPRPLRLVAALPRDSTSKLTRRALRQALEDAEPERRR